MTDKNVPAPLSEDEPIGSPMNDNETKPYPANDPLSDLLADKTVPLPSGVESTSSPATHGAASDNTAGRSTSHTQDATTTESFAWTGEETTPSAAPTGAGTQSWSNTAPQAAPTVPPVWAPVETQGPRPARAGTIVWGCILFLVAALAAVPAILGDSVLSPTAFLWIVVCFGTLLVVGAVVGAIVSAATRRSRAERTTTY